MLKCNTESTSSWYIGSYNMKLIILNLIVTRSNIYTQTSQELELVFRELIHSEFLQATASN